MKTAWMITIGTLLFLWDTIMVVGIFEAMDHPFCISGWFGILCIISAFITFLYFYKLLGGDK